jgi:hypothetical protein
MAAVHDNPLVLIALAPTIMTNRMAGAWELTNPLNLNNLLALPMTKRAGSAGLTG